MLDICEYVNMIIPYVAGEEQSNVSHHLAILKWAGLARDEKRGSWVWYRLFDPMVAKMLDLVHKLICQEAHNRVRVVSLK